MIEYAADFSDTQPIWNKDPAGSNGIANYGTGLRPTPSTNNSHDNTPTSTALYAIWSSDSTALLPPVAPQNLTITNVSSNEIDMTWIEDLSNQTGFYVDRSTSSTGGFASIATLGATATAYSNTGLTSGTTYYYEIQAYNTYSTSLFSNIEGAQAGGSGMGVRL